MRDVELVGRDRGQVMLCHLPSKGSAQYIVQMLQITVPVLHPLAAGRRLKRVHWLTEMDRPTRLAWGLLASPVMIVLAVLLVGLVEVLAAFIAITFSTW